MEDASGRRDTPIYDAGLAAERVQAAAEVAHRGPIRLVVTAPAENYLHGRPDLADTIARLQAYQEAGADVLYAPGLRRPWGRGRSRHRAPRGRYLRVLGSRTTGRNAARSAFGP